MDFKPGLIWKPKKNKSEGLITAVSESVVFVKWIKNAEGATKHEPKEQMYSRVNMRNILDKALASLIDPKNSSDDPNMAFRFRKGKI